MTSPIRIFALQTQKIGNLLGSGGGAEVDQALAAALCSGMPEKWYKAARLTWCLDASVTGYLNTQVWIELCEIASREQWRMSKGAELLRRMAELAVVEIAMPEKYSKPSAWRDKIDHLGISKTQWYSTWLPRYEIGYQLLNDWTNRAYGYLVNRQEEE